MTTLGFCRRLGAIMALRFARLVLRGSVTLYQRRAIPRFVLRAGLAVTRALEHAGALFALGRQRAPAQASPKREETNDRID